MVSVAEMSLDGDLLRDAVAEADGDSVIDADGEGVGGGVMVSVTV